MIKIFELITDSLVPIACVFLTYFYQYKRNKYQLVFEKKVSIYTTISSYLFTYVNDLICLVGKIDINDDDVKALKENTQNFIKSVIIKQVFVNSFLYSAASRKVLNEIKDEILNFQTKLLLYQKPYRYSEIKDLTQNFLKNYLMQTMQFIEKISIEIK